MKLSAYLLNTRAHPTPEINQHNFNYYGALEDFQVYGRQGDKGKQIYQDVRSLDWFLTKTGEQGSVPEAQATIVQTVEPPNFYLDKAWNLPDGSTLKLYHRRTPSTGTTPHRVKTRARLPCKSQYRNKPRLGTGASNIRVVWFLGAVAIRFSTAELA